MLHAVLTITQFTLVEAMRSRLFLLFAGLLVAALGLAEFAAALAITEQEAIRRSVAAGLTRWGSVLIVGLFTVSSLGREFQERSVQLLFALPYPRSTYYLGKLAGLAAVALLLALMAGAAQLLQGADPAVAAWSLSLFCELLLVVGLSLLLVFTFNQLTAAVAGLLAFYLLGRSIDSFLLMASGPLYTQSSALDQAILWALRGIAYLLPSFERFTRADWLIYPDLAWPALPDVLGQTLVYAVLLAAAALFDLYRKAL